jgi:hypothetical protein
VGLKKGPWTAEEDQKLVAFLLTHGHCCWRLVPKLAGQETSAAGPAALNLIFSMLTCSTPLADRIQG